jgi:hypothetical protein
MKKPASLKGIISALTDIIGRTGAEEEGFFRSF